MSFASEALQTQRRALRAVERLLRAEERFAPAAASPPLGALALAIVACGAVYGAALGAWSRNPAQVVYAAIKLPIVLTFSSVLCVPCFWVAHALLGIRRDFTRSLAGILSGQAALAIALASLTPVVLFLEFAVGDYQWVKIGNGLLFLLASGAGQVLLRRHYAALIAEAPAHRVALRLWPILHAFVAAQVAWTLRPYFGAPWLRAQFVRDDALQNVYLEILWLLLGAAGVR